MKIQFWSDLHIEYHFDLPLLVARDTDVLILAGDVGQGMMAREFFAAQWRHRPNLKIVYILGNHEFFNHTYESVRAFWRDYRDPRLFFLDNSSVVIQGIRFCGCSLWTDFDGDNAHSKKRALESVSDFRRISKECSTKIGEFPPNNLSESRFVTNSATNTLVPSASNTESKRVSTYMPRFASAGHKRPEPPLKQADLRNWTPDDALAAHRECLAFLTRELETPFVGPTVFITHHLPSFRSVTVDYQKSDLNGAFATNLHYLLEKHPGIVHAWIHGHVHETLDYNLHGTRILCNARGLVRPRVLENPNFVSLKGFVLHQTTPFSEMKNLPEPAYARKKYSQTRKGSYSSGNYCAVQA